MLVIELKATSSRNNKMLLAIRAENSFKLLVALLCERVEGRVLFSNGCLVIVKPHNLEGVISQYQAVVGLRDTARLDGIAYS